MVVGVVVRGGELGLKLEGGRLGVAWGGVGWDGKSTFWRVTRKTPQNRSTR